MMVLKKDIKEDNSFPSIKNRGNEEHYNDHTEFEHNKNSLKTLFLVKKPHKNKYENDKNEYEETKDDE